MAGAPPTPALDIARSHATLLRVSRGELPSLTRVYRPAATLAFGRLDARRAGYVAAAAAARAHGFAAVMRLAGGQAAAYDEQSLVVERFLGPGAAGDDLHVRFADMTALIVGALRDLGVDARHGELPGEYCPGRHSVNSRGTLKVAGAAQRVVRDAAMVSAVIVVGNGAAVRDVLTDVYAALEIAWRPETAGSLDEHHPALTVDDVEEAILAALGGDALRCPDAVTEALAVDLTDRHES
jgi:lipoate-protein ligase A